MATNTAVAPVRWGHRLRVLEAISRSSVHRSLATSSSEEASMSVCRNFSAVRDPLKALDLIRTLLQRDINEKISQAMEEFIDGYFAPAVSNIRQNLGVDQVCDVDALLKDVCVSALDHAKAVFITPRDNVPPVLGVARRNDVSGKGVRKAAKRKSTSEMAKIAFKLPRSAASDLILLTKHGKPVRREGSKWSASRLDSDTLFILGSKANKALGFGRTRGRLYIKHPEMFKYSCDQEDKEWMIRNRLVSTTGGKSYLMVLADIVELASSSEYLNHPNVTTDALVGFRAPFFMLDKMKKFMEDARTDPDTPDDVLLAKAKECSSVLKANSTDKHFAGHPKTTPPTSTPEVIYSFTNESKDLEGVLEDVEDETSGCETSGGEDDLGFLQGMNLNSLVQEFEMEATGAGNGCHSLGGLLSLADDECNEFTDLPGSSTQGSSSTDDSRKLATTDSNVNDDNGSTVITTSPMNETSPD